MFMVRGTASAKAEKRGRAWLLPETEISPVMTGKIVGVFPPEPVGQQAVRCQPVSSLGSSSAPWGGRPLRADQVSEWSGWSCSWPSWEWVTGAGSGHCGRELGALELQEVGEEGGGRGPGWRIPLGPQAPEPLCVGERSCAGSQPGFRATRVP